MKDEYVIISKIAIQKRIEELESRRDSDKCSDPRDFSYLTGKILALEQILSQSTPLIPEIEAALGAGLEVGDITSNSELLKDYYISNLKLAV